MCIHIHIYKNYAGTKALDSSYVIWFPIKPVKVFRCASFLLNVNITPVIFTDIKYTEKYEAKFEHYIKK